MEIISEEQKEWERKLNLWNQRCYALLDQKFSFLGEEEKKLKVESFLLYAGPEFKEFSDRLEYQKQEDTVQKICDDLIEEIKSARKEHPVKVCCFPNLPFPKKKILFIFIFFNFFYYNIILGLLILFHKNHKFFFASLFSEN